jgi:hypothetical protein
MSDLPEFKRYVANAAEDLGHVLDYWRWAPLRDGTPAHAATCKRPQDCSQGLRCHVINSAMITATLRRIAATSTLTVTAT